MSQNKSFAGSLAVDLDKIHDSWGWFVALGIAFMVLGAVCIIGDVTATLVSVLAFGWLLVIGAVAALVQSFRTREWSGFFLYFLTALLRGFTGYLLIRYPFSGEVGLTLLLASLFMVGGIFRATGASTLRFPNWGWAVASGIVSVALGVMLLYQLPVISIWFIGFAIGVDFIFDGASLTALGLAVRHVPAGRDFARA
ncbi:MAG: HdeD family acid-resistance protein [Deltaproteobacteria bacterium]|nr:HdeD family acid-resistance protein [Deltaproteobacteria bacterium]